jgi:hypothetical protein
MNSKRPSKIFLFISTSVRFLQHINIFFTIHASEPLALANIPYCIPNEKVKQTCIIYMEW